MVGVAQLVEPRIVIPVVVGSNPISHPKASSFEEAFYLLYILNYIGTLCIY